MKTSEQKIKELPTLELLAWCKYIRKLSKTSELLHKLSDEICNRMEYLAKDDIQ